MKYDLVRPCPKCPFRTDVPGYLRRARAAEIARVTNGGAAFPCHQTTVPVEDEFGDDFARDSTSDSRFCAGALIAMEKGEGPNQIMRIAERIGVYDADKLDMDSPVVDSLAAFVEHHGEDDEVPETCEVVDMGCLAPAGFMDGGLVVHNYDVDPDDMTQCEACGVPVCIACSEDDVCNRCKEDE